MSIGLWLAVTMCRAMAFLPIQPGDELARPDPD
jgi:hypothetical protein